jgi:hypothetical protein
MTDNLKNDVDRAIELGVSGEVSDALEIIKAYNSKNIELRALRVETALCHLANNIEGTKNFSNREAICLLMRIVLFGKRKKEIVDVADFIEYNLNNEISETIRKKYKINKN